MSIPQSTLRTRRAIRFTATPIPNSDLLSQSQDSQTQNTTPEHKDESSKQDSSETEDVKGVNSVSEKNPEAPIDSKSKTLKKPDKILPCPRCQSMETKFCYYNNYNVNQPRHFCKHCQRYWTAGGTMRNVPVGAGRRKSKSSATQLHELATSVYRDAADSVPYSLNPNGSVLSFGSNSQVVNRTEKNITGKIDDSTESDSQNPCEAMACNNGVPWPCSWAQIAGFSGQSFAIPLYWTCAVPPSGWTVSNVSHMSSNSAENCCERQGENSFGSLGKHSRNDEEEAVRISTIPKTMRIGDSQESAKSSIWTMIGLKNGQGDESKGVGLCRAFESKVEIMKKNSMETSKVLCANPAALARSMNFLERS